MKIKRIGVDLAKNVFQLHGVDTGFDRWKITALYTHGVHQYDIATAIGAFW